MKVITKMNGLRLLEEIANNNLSCGTMIRYKREDIALMTNPPQPVYEYYKYTAGDKRFHRCDENGKLGSKGQQRFMNYGTLKKEFEVVEIIEKDKEIEELKAPEDIIPYLKGFSVEYGKWEEEQVDELIENFNNLSTDISKNRKTINEITECLVLLIDEVNRLKNK